MGRWLWEFSIPFRTSFACSPNRSSDYAIEAPLRAHFALIARCQTIDHQHDETAPGEFGCPITFAATNQAGGSIEQTVTAMQKTSAGYLPLPVGRNMQRSSQLSHSLSSRNRASRYRNCRKSSGESVSAPIFTNPGSGATARGHSVGTAISSSGPYC